MKTKVRLCIVLIAIVCLAAAVKMIGFADVGVTEVMSSYSDYKHAKELDSSKWVAKVDEYNQKLTELNTEKDELNQEYEELKAEVTRLNNSKGEVEDLDGSLLYQKLVLASIPSSAEVTKFYDFGDGSYMVTLAGHLGSINLAVQALTENLSDWHINIGNFSLRQNYEVYDLERTYDTGTLLEWYDNKIVNALGETIDLEELLVLVNESEEEDPLYTLISLEDVKLDTEGMNTEIKASNSYYEKKLNEALSNYGEQIMLVEQTDYTDTVKDELKASLESEYNQTVAKIKANKESAAKAIENKYQKKYENEKKEVVDALQLYEDKLVELRSILLDNSELEYVLDLTFQAE